MYINSVLQAPSFFFLLIRPTHFGGGGAVFVDVAA